MSRDTPSPHPHEAPKHSSQQHSNQQHTEQRYAAGRGETLGMDTYRDGEKKGRGQGRSGGESETQVQGDFPTSPAASYTRNPEPETRSRKPETLNPRPETLNQKP